MVYHIVVKSECKRPPMWLPIKTTHLIRMTNRPIACVFKLASARNTNPAAVIFTSRRDSPALKLLFY